MFLAFPKCNWKCGSEYCQNSELAIADDIEIDLEKLVDRFVKNPINKAIVCGGLEPFDSFFDLFNFIKQLRFISDATVVIYTGYNKTEILKFINYLQKNFTNIIVKFGRFFPRSSPIFDSLLGVNLASNNQYAEQIS